MGYDKCCVVRIETHFVGCTYILSQFERQFISHCELQIVFSFHCIMSKCGPYDLSDVLGWQGPGSS